VIRAKAAAALAATIACMLEAAALGAAASPAGPSTVKGACTSTDGWGMCSRCEVALRHDLELPETGSLIGACPRMAPGRYGLAVAVPVKLVPPLAGSGADSGPTFFQIHASITARALDGRGGESDLIPVAAPASWSWWKPSGAPIDRDDVLELERGTAVQVSFRLDDAQYYLPNQTQGDAHHDGKLMVDPGTVIRLTRLPASAAEAKAPREPDLSDSTLAKITPGRTRKAQVEALLGKPTHEAKHGDEEHPANDVWDYRGHDSGVHVEFDAHDVVAIIAKIPDESRSAAARVATPPPASAKP
jgi:hypothetical protein